MNANQDFSAKRKRHETQIHLNGQRVGEAYKLTGESGFGLRLRGVYWRKGEPNNRGGSTVAGYTRLRDAVAAAQTVLGNVELTAHLRQREGN